MFVLQLEHWHTHGQWWQVRGVCNTEMPSSLCSAYKLHWRNDPSCLNPTNRFSIGLNFLVLKCKYIERYQFKTEIELLHAFLIANKIIEQNCHTVWRSKYFSIEFLLFNTVSSLKLCNSKTILEEMECSGDRCVLSIDWIQRYLQQQWHVCPNVRSNRSLSV